MPTDKYHTMAQLNTIFQALTLSILGIDPEQDNKAYSKVRVSWPTGGAPAWKIGEDVAFLRIQAEDSAVNRQRDVRMMPQDADNANQETSYTRVVGVTWVFYGPNSYDHAQKVTDYLFYQTHHDALAKENIFMVPDIAAPRRAPELFEGQWWERSDLKISFNELITRNLSIPYLQSADITIDNGAGTVNDIHVVPN